MNDLANVIHKMMQQENVPLAAPDIKTAPLTGHLLEAAIDLGSWQISIKIDEKIPEKITASFPWAKQDIVNQMIGNVCRHAYLHEKGHWQFCPFDKEHHQVILIGVSRAMADYYQKRWKDEADRRFQEERSTGTCHHLANIFTDLVVNLVISLQDKAYAHGFEICALNDLQREDKKTRKKSDIDRWYLMFNAIHCAALPGYFPLLEKQHQIKKLLGQKTALKGVKILLAGLEDLPAQLLNRKEWQEKAYALARLFLPLISTAFSEQKMRPFSNFFSRKCEEDAETLEEYVRYFRKHDAPCLFTGKLTALDALFCQQAREVSLAYQQNNDESDPSRAEISFLHLKKVEKGGHLDLSRLKWSATRLYPGPNGDDTLELYQQYLPVVEEEQGNATGIIKDILFIADSSGSMSFYEDPDDGGEYDLLLLAFYSLVRWLKNIGVAQVMRFGAVNFSSETTFSGWWDYHSLEIVKKCLLKHQGYSTRLDLNVLREMYSTRLDPFWAIMVTDGKIDNEKETADFIKEMINDGNSFTMIQIGEPSGFIEQLAGVCPVYCLNGPDDLVGLVLSEGEKQWQI